MNWQHILDLLVVALAAGHLLYAWQFTELFASWRSRLEASSGWLSHWLLCPVCLAPYLVAGLFVLTILPGWLWDWPWYGLACIPYTLALARIACKVQEI